MDWEESIRRIEDHMRVHRIGLYPHIHLGEALYEAIVALKKQIPMEHHHTIVNEIRNGEKARGSVCPNCLGWIITAPEDFPRFCTWCGQAIDWSDMDK